MGLSPISTGRTTKEIAMREKIFPARTRAALAAVEPLQRYIEQTGWFYRLTEPGICDFTIGNPHDVPPPGFVEALASKVTPQNDRWYAYKMNEPGPRAVLAKSLKAWRGIDFDEKDIFLTNGATAGLHVVFETIIGPGDEAIFMSPPWFQYESMIIIAGGTPVRVKVDPKTYDLDFEALEKAITEKTRVVIINSPHNPTGKIYSPDTLRRLAALLTGAGKRYGRTIHIVSDESYSRIVFDNRKYHSPTEFYADTFLVYTYGKVLLTPGQRIGFIALPPGMQGKDEIRKAIEGFQMLNGWAFPNAILQHALADLDRISVDINRLQQRRDRVVTALRNMGYETSNPEGTFYILVKSPMKDDVAFTKTLADNGIFCIPGTLMDLPGYIRLSLTANDEMVERAIPKFAEALRTVRT
jgi:aspartate aminotransferase